MSAPRILQILPASADGNTTWTINVRDVSGTVLYSASNSWPSTTPLSTMAAWAAPQLKGALGAMTVADLAAISTADDNALGMALLLLLSR